jgi:hypothetical protein
MLVGLGVTALASSGSGHRHEHGKDHHAPRKPLAIGIVHGASGTAALTLLVASTITVRLHALAFVVLFALASIVGMAVVAALVAWPLRSALKRAPAIESVLRGLAGTASIAAGLAIGWSLLASASPG